MQHPQGPPPHGMRHRPDLSLRQPEETERGGEQHPQKPPHEQPRTPHHKRRHPNHERRSSGETHTGAHATNASQE